MKDNVFRMVACLMLWATVGCNGSSDEGVCRGKDCDDPPADRCEDGFTLIDYPGAGKCDPDTGECVYVPVEVPCEHGCVDGACTGGPGSGFALVVPDDSFLCTLDKGDLSSLDLFENYATAARVELRPGRVELPMQEQRVESSFIGRVEFGPDRTVLDADGPGVFERSIDGTAENGVYRYLFTQIHPSGALSYHLIFQISFEVAGGEPVEPTVVLDGAALADDGFDFEGVLLDESSQMMSSRLYTGCAYEGYRALTFDLGLANNDTLHLDTVRIRASFIRNMNTALVGAVYTRGLERREVRDHFRLQYSSYGHNWQQRFLVVFDEPLDDIHGVYLEEEIDNQVMWKLKTLQYLDADLTPAGSVAIDSVEIQWED